MPAHSTLSRTRARLPLEVHAAVFVLVLGLLAERGLVEGRRLGVAASTMEANAAMRSIVRREDGAGWQAVDRGPHTPINGRARPEQRDRDARGGPAPPARPHAAQEEGLERRLGQPRGSERG